jgi:hypothetical protein
MAGLLTAAALGVLQIRASGAVTYYFWKFAIGLELVSLVIAVLMVTSALEALPQNVPRHRGWMPLVATALSAVAATQAFGFTGLHLGATHISPTADGIVRRGILAQAAASPSATVREILAATGTHVANGSHAVYLSPSSDTAIHPVSAQQWFMSLTGAWTVEGNARTSALMPAPGGGTASDADRALRVLRSDPSSVVIVAPDRLAEVRDGLGDDTLTSRVTTW